MKICLFGNKGATTALLRHLQAHAIAIDTVVVLAPSARSRINIAGGDDTLAAIAKEAGAKVYGAEKYALNMAQDTAFFAKEQFDIGLCAGWQRLIPSAILDQFKLGVFGWHGSGFRFPNGRGRSPLNWSIRLGLDVVYHNCFRYASGADDGQVYETQTLPIAPEDHIADLQAKALTHIKASALRLLEDAQRGPLVLKPQPEHPFITFPALSETSGFLPLHALTQQEAINITRSCSRPFPGAFVKLHGADEKIRIWQLAQGPARDLPADISVGEAICHQDRLYLRLSDGVVVCDDFDLPAGAAMGRFVCE